MLVPDIEVGRFCLSCVGITRRQSNSRAMRIVPANGYATSPCDKMVYVTALADLCCLTALGCA